MRPVVCFVEDCPSRIENVIEMYDSWGYRRSFDLCFIVCEQHYWDQLGDRGEEFLRSVEYPQSVHSASLFDYAKHGIPDLFFVDMMLEWTSPFYESTRIQHPTLQLNEAGLRIVKDIEFSFDENERPAWWIWTAVDCTGSVDEIIKDKIRYKDQEPLVDLLRFAQTEARISSRRAGKKSRTVDP
ncbi:hypothetical protein [Roseiconus lacunae]|uniref:hypothetical protein n=1 Tax=Roseiconus lacunae TaxID=2605694 RepID=UPI001E4F19CC|nr:hypothetical protein [Roseiconus lacunae]MCD0461403.1 hypothetical protein [Roseiconus lacunae]